MREHSTTIFVSSERFLLRGVPEARRPHEAKQSAEWRRGGLSRKAGWLAFPTQCMRLEAACLTSPWGVLGSRPSTGRVSCGFSLRRNSSSRKEADRRYWQEVDSRRRQSNGSAYPPDPCSINVLLRPAGSLATQSRQAPSPTPFPPARATTPTRTGAESICCTGNVVRKLRGSRDTQQGARLLPWPCGAGHACHSRGEPDRPPSSRGG